MNSAKRVANQSMKKSTSSKSNKGAKEPGKSRVIILSGVAAVVVFLLAMVCWENLHPRIIFTVNGEKVYLKDMMMDIYMTESTGSYMDSLYQQNYGSSYWSAESTEGITNADLLKNNTVDSAMQKAMLYSEAIEKGYTLSEEEITEVESNATSVFDQMTATVKNKTGLTKDRVKDYYEKKTLADRYKADWIDTFDIDDAALTADVSREEYRQYDIQYYYIPYTSTDENGEQVEKTDSEKAAAVEELEASYDDIIGLEDFTTYTTPASTEEDSEEESEVVDEGPKAPEGTNIMYTSKSFTEKDEVNFGDELLEVIKSLDNDSITEVVEDEFGCYLIKMIDNNSSEAYDSECNSIITEAENKEFQNQIEQLEVDKYLIEMNDKEWEKVKFGRVTIN